MAAVIHGGQRIKIRDNERQTTILESFGETNYVIP